MVWRVDDSLPRITYEKGKHTEVPSAAMRTYHQWRRLINNGETPMNAARASGDLHFEQLSGRNRGVYTIRLSQEHRVVFTLDNTLETVNVIQIGGHYP